ncbi:hypothetical protein QYE76_026578 [Lolium multiflorum]|uniref:Uncharacterized protein n=1 Tax=Lolium multiflorum TaxID=4521 RepID=A0AAD8RHY5_LOLMU|nr:hypothetical protein QYE76_026578 [Lolium multiflorum]
MAEGTPVTYEDLTEELKKKYDEVKATADLIGSFTNPTWHQVERVLTRRRARWSGPVRPVEERTGPGHHSGKDGDEGSRSRSKDTEKPFHVIGSVTMASAHQREK